MDKTLFKVGDVVRFRVLNAPAKVITEGVVIKVLPPDVNLRKVLSEDSIRGNYDTSRLSCVGSRNHYSYIVCDKVPVPRRRPKLYWPLVAHIEKPVSNQLESYEQHKE